MGGANLVPFRGGFVEHLHRIMQVAGGEMLVREKITILVLSLLPAFTTSILAYAETKILNAEASYIMGDGETPSFADAMALQKAKQAAIEQAGTYIESYTKVQNYALTEEEIKTIAGGVLEVEVLEKTRTLVGDGLRIYIKIKATVTTDKMEELAQRIKGKNVADEYKRLQEEYSRLAREIETWKQLVTKSTSGPQRDEALEQIREREMAFNKVQKTEAALFQHLLSGDVLVAKALDLLAQKQKQKAIVDTFLQKLFEQGLIVTFGEPEIPRMSLESPENVRLYIPVTMKVVDEFREVIKETTHSLDGLISDKKVTTTKSETGIRIAADKEIEQYFQQRLQNRLFLMELVFKNGKILRCYDYHRVRYPFQSDAKNSFYSLIISWYPREFTWALNLSLKEVQAISSIRGKFIERDDTSITSSC